MLAALCVLWAGDLSKEANFVNEWTLFLYYQLTFTLPDEASFSLGSKMEQLDTCHRVTFSLQSVGLPWQMPPRAD